MIRIIAFLLIPFCSISQNITGNVNDINSILKLHSYNVETPPSYIYHHYNQIRVDKNGKLTLVNYRENKKTLAYFDKEIRGYLYLNTISLGENNDLEEGKYSVTVNCLNGKSCVIYPETELVMAYKEKAIDFLFDNRDARDKFRVAFSRMLDDVHNKAEFQK
ncbi:MAG TPA: hypothetical protein VFI33_08370 [Puia sp.]|nr:hypothetical protein [Puia sp.]